MPEFLGAAPLDRVPREGEQLAQRVTRTSRPDYKVNPLTGCWEWLKGRTPQGYPNAYMHRRYFERANGPIIEGYLIHHKCQNKGCVNPDHLEQEHPSWHVRLHMWDQKGKLTWEQARTIRHRCRTEPDTTYRVLADEYGVSHGHIQDIAEGIAFRENDAHWIKPTRGCAYCGEIIPQERRRHTKYCKPACKASANYRSAKERHPGRNAQYQRDRRARMKAEAA